MTQQEMEALQQGDTVWVSVIKRSARVTNAGLSGIPWISLRWITEDARLQFGNLYADEIELKRPT